MAILICPNCFARPSACEFNLCSQCYDIPIIREAWRVHTDKRKGRVKENAVITQRCTRPPAGWWCSRTEGHDGPCAARPESTQRQGDPHGPQVKDP